MKTYKINDPHEYTNKHICNARGCQETSKIIVEEPIEKSRTIKLYLCYSCSQKFQR